MAEPPAPVTFPPAASSLAARPTDVTIQHLHAPPSSDTGRRLSTASSATAPSIASPPSNTASAGTRTGKVSPTQARKDGFVVTEGDMDGAQKDGETEGKSAELELLLPSGARKRWRFPSDSSVADVKQVVFKEWPPEWATERPAPTSAGDLRLLFLGRFLADKEKLSEQRLHGSESAAPCTIMHLMIRPPPPPEDEELKAGRKRCPSCCIVS